MLLTAAVIIVLLYAAGNNMAYAVRNMACIFILTLVSIRDIEDNIIPNRCIAAMTALWGVFALFADRTAEPAIQISAAIMTAGLFLLASVLIKMLTGRKAMGAGDIKLAFACGLYMGMTKFIAMIVFTCMTALLYTLLFKKKGSRIFPLGPSISMSAVLLLTGNNSQFVHWLY